MRRRHILYTASVAALASVSSALAQQSLPTIDIGGVRHGNGDVRRGPGAARTSTNADSDGDGAGDGRGGAGAPVLTPQNSYVVPNASTATKTNTPIMNTPINVQVITQKVMEDQQDITLAQALRNVSGVYVPTASQYGGFARTAGVVIRGFQTPNIFRDGFRMEGLGNADVGGARQLANVSSIEVLKGPAAVLYGLSEPGGIVNIMTKEPQATPHYAINQQIGSLALYRTVANATGPLTADKSILYRLDTSYENNGAPYGSFIDLTHSQNFFIAPVVKWSPSESTWLKVEAEYNNDLASMYRPDNPTFRGAFVTRPRNVNYTENSPIHSPSIFAALIGSHKFNDDLSFKARVGYFRIDYTATQTTLAATSVTGGANPAATRFTNIVYAPQTTFSANLDVVGHFDVLFARNTVLLGSDYYRTSFASTLVTAPWGWSRISLAYPSHPGAPITPPVGQAITGFGLQETIGAYLQDQIELPYNIHVMAGFRYQKIIQENNTLTAVAPPARLNLTTPRLEKDAVTPRFGLLWRPQEWVSVYGNYTEGFASNGVSQVYPGDLVPPSNAKSWEAGIKFEFFGGKLRATADYYELTKTNVPITDNNPAHVCGLGSCVLIGGEARSKGPELDIQGEVLPGWNLIVTYTNQDVRVTKGTSIGFGQGGTEPGQRFPNVPRNLASLWSTYEFQDELFKGLKVGAGYTYHGSQPIQNSMAARFGTPPLLASWGTVDLMSAYTFSLDGLKTTAQLNVTNLFDRTYYTDGAISANPTNGFNIAGRLSYGAPFAALGSLRVEF
ncbi:TonB-dependent siderophore receptor [Methylocystis sp.]|uniref:TonB-dependent siderophore receptor n=1 Tax=Methylocystis sp. TaxID=1911079 RepID=UPI0025F3EF06|nr:TonB-dependent siderophore receptor [Methylocystis sp.]